MIMTDQERKEANLGAVRELRHLTADARAIFRELDSRLKIAYLILLTLSILMFAVGTTLIGVSVYEAIWGDSETQSGISGGLGVADLATLFLFRPIERIHSLMGDMSQMAMAVSSYQTQTNLRLIAMDINHPTTVGEAADHIRLAAESGVRLVQDYFEAKARR